MCSVCISLFIVIFIVTVVFISYPHFAYWREQITGLIAGLTSEVWSAKEVGPTIIIVQLLNEIFLKPVLRIRSDMAFFCRIRSDPAFSCRIRTAKTRSEPEVFNDYPLFFNIKCYVTCFSFISKVLLKLGNLFRTDNTLCSSSAPDPFEQLERSASATLLKLTAKYTLRSWWSLL